MTAAFDRYAARYDFLFVFPRSLHALRPLEPFLTGWPIGAQYQVLGHKP
jgi:hypothetical protein